MSSSILRFNSFVRISKVLVGADSLPPTLRAPAESFSRAPEILEGGTEGKQSVLETVPFLPQCQLSVCAVPHHFSRDWPLQVDGSLLPAVIFKDKKSKCAFQNLGFILFQS